MDCLVSSKELYSKRCVLIWKTLDTKYLRLLFQLQASTLRIEEKGFGLLPTVQTQGLKVCQNGQSKFLKTNMLPTPTSIDQGTGRINKSKSKNARERPTIALAARMGLLPTPTASNGMQSPIILPRNGKNQGRLQYVIAEMFLPTPLASDNGEKVTGLEKQDSLTKRARKMTGKTSQLNPLFVAEMMGFPTNWTVLPFLNGEKKV